MNYFINVQIVGHGTATSCAPPPPFSAGGLNLLPNFQKGKEGGGGGGLDRTSTLKGGLLEKRR